MALHSSRLFFWAFSIVPVPFCIQKSLHFEKPVRSSSGRQNIVGHVHRTAPTPWTRQYSDIKHTYKSHLKISNHVTLKLLLWNVYIDLAEFLKIFALLLMSFWNWERTVQNNRLVSAKWHAPFQPCLACKWKLVRHAGVIWAVRITRESLGSSAPTAKKVPALN
jgi:hypothetical protein